MLSEQVSDRDSVTMNGHRAHETSVSPSTLRQHVGAGETLKGPAARLSAALIGLGLFGASFGAFHLADTPPEGVLALLLEISGWLGMLAAARIVTRRWLAPTLVLTSGSCSWSEILSVRDSSSVAPIGGSS